MGTIISLDDFFSQKNDINIDNNEADNWEDKSGKNKYTLKT